MLAAGCLELPPTADEYCFEYKWDGVRALCYCEGGSVRIESRNGIDVTAQYPELLGLAAETGRSVILDGEIIAIDVHNRPSFAMLQRRMHVQDPRKVGRLVQEIPAWLMLFDLLWVDGQLLMDRPLRQRRQALEDLALGASAAWRLSPMRCGAGEGQAMLRSARELGLEGIVAKRSDSRYEPGRRSGAWLKIKLVRRQELVIGGWVPEGGTDRRRVGALLLGYHGGAATGLSAGLRYAGSVGSGFDARWQAMLPGLLASLEQAQSPFAGVVPKPHARFVRPELVAEVEYRRWPPGAHIQQAAFKGLRWDKRPREVIRECVEEVA